jgi:hypothetical protein
LLLPPPGPHMASWEPVAQPVEHLTFNQGVSGSNPDGLTTSIKELGPRCRSRFPPKATECGGPVHSVKPWRLEDAIGEPLSEDDERASATIGALLRAWTAYNRSLGNQVIGG